MVGDGSESEIRSSSTLDCAVDAQGFEALVAALPFLVLRALEVRRGTAVCRGCRVDAVRVVGANDVPAPFERGPLAFRKPEAAELGSGGAIALARC